MLIKLERIFSEALWSVIKMLRRLAAQTIMVLVYAIELKRLSRKGCYTLLTDDAS